MSSVDLPLHVAQGLAALRRAALQARRIALQTNTDLIVWRSGQLVRVIQAKKQIENKQGSKE